ncbi:hypothetical protein U1Q18_042821 [Sarracenia purpurea var. burkii]
MVSPSLILRWVWKQSSEVAAAENQHIEKETSGIFGFDFLPQKLRNQRRTPADKITHSPKGLKPDLGEKIRLRLGAGKKGAKRSLLVRIETQREEGLLSPRPKPWHPTAVHRHQHRRKPLCHPLRHRPPGRRHQPTTPVPVRFRCRRRHREP